MKVTELIEELQNYVNHYGEELVVFVSNTEKQGYIEEASGSMVTSSTENESIVDGVIII